MIYQLNEKLKMKKIIITVFLAVFAVGLTNAQYTSLNAHSHNDYEQDIPFLTAYNCHFGSIEADIWAEGDELFVAHNKSEIKPERTLDTLYIRPIAELFRTNKGHAWADHPGTFQLLIDLKTVAEPTLSLLVDKLSKYPEVFDPSYNENAVRIVISGNRPASSKFQEYPAFISFDGDLKLRYTAEERKRIAVFSTNLQNLISWTGEGKIPKGERRRMVQVIDSIHALGNKIRFWNAPDTPTAWQTLMNLRVDYINTDHIQALADYLQKR